MARLVVGPFNRVEGDLEVRLDVDGGQVRSAQVVAPMYRGFEPMLLGRDPLDALVIVPRICGICSVSQSLAAARALADAAGVAPPPNGALALNLMAATENAADHLTHFYLFFMPDFTRPAYAGQPWFDEACRRFAAPGGEHARAAVAARQRWFEIMGWLGGRWPHTHSLLPGGSSRAIEPAEALRLLTRVREFRAFVERQLVGGSVDELLALPDEAALQAWADDGRGGDLRLFLRIAADTGLAALGRSGAPCLSYGAFPDADGVRAWATGLWQPDGLQPLALQGLTEDATFAWLSDAGGPRHPRHGLTQPDADKPGAYSWNKAPRLGGRPVETGAAARQLCAGQPLVTDLAQRHGVGVLVRVVARLLELVRLVPLMEGWVQALVPRQPFARAAALPAEAEGCGLNEAARGALGHWLRIEGGRLVQYQIVAPTSWNFSPRDASGLPGPLEQALVGVPVPPGERTPVAVQHVVRSFDPCMVCTVH
ncbi:MAG: nickel-dependent hydrogenase large subunit [Rubrivivax sp.]